MRTQREGGLQHRGHEQQYKQQQQQQHEGYKRNRQQHSEGYRHDKQQYGQQYQYQQQRGGYKRNKLHDEGYIIHNKQHSEGYKQHSGAYKQHSEGYNHDKQQHEQQYKDYEQRYEGYEHDKQRNKGFSHNYKHHGGYEGQHEGYKYEKQQYQNQYEEYEQQILQQQRDYQQERVEQRQRKEQHRRHQLQQLQHHTGRVQDWVKPPHHKGAWHSFHEPYRLLQYFLEYADKINGVVYNTLNIAIATSELDEFEIKLSPMCASGQEDLGIFLPLGIINQLGLESVGDYETRNYGRVKTYTGIALRLEAYRSKDCIYKIPDGYVYELPEIFSSATLAATSYNGNPQRQGIIHRELLFKHALVSYANLLFCLSEEMFNSSGIPEVMFKNSRCEVEIPSTQGKKPQKINVNSTLRRMSYQRELDVVHPCFLNDFFIKEIVAPPFVYYTTTPMCCQCQKTENLFYCTLCRKRYVQSPHVYCSKICQKTHWSTHHCKFHLDSASEQQVILSPAEGLKRVEFQTNNHPPTSENSYEKLNDMQSWGRTIEDASYEHFVVIFFVFYACFWYILKSHTDDEHDL